MRFTSRDLTDQFISSSYQDVLQNYPTATVDYVLDGLGNVIFSIPSSSLGNSVITSNITSSMTVKNAISSSYAEVYTIVNEITSSFSSQSISSSYALTASYALNGGTGGSSGLIIPDYDYSNVEYLGPGGQFSTVTYKIGGSAGTTVCILTAIYSGSIYTGITKSLG